ncbi:MAG: TIGR00296 family protein [Thermoplasmata archaeon]|nr:TIGR00296 family protein [Thermoplasmata archaeon]
MYTIEDGKSAVKLARETIKAHLAGKSDPTLKLPTKFNSKSGVFVTLNTYPDHQLRGCIGYPEPHEKLKLALIDSAKSASTRDPRFNPVAEDELDNIVIEVSLLTPPEVIKVKKPKDYLKKIKIGQDGLIVERGLNRGLLLPQVPVEWKWDVEEFLSHTCMKAGLQPDSWFETDVVFYKFSAEIFSEQKPGGKVVRKKLL